MLRVDDNLKPNTPSKKSYPVRTRQCWRTVTQILFFLFGIGPFAWYFLLVSISWYLNCSIDGGGVKEPCFLFGMDISYALYSTVVLPFFVPLFLLAALALLVPMVILERRSKKDLKERGGWTLKR